MNRMFILDVNKEDIFALRKYIEDSGWGNIDRVNKIISDLEEHLSIDYKIVVEIEGGVLTDESFPDADNLSFHVIDRDDAWDEDDLIELWKDNGGK